MPTTCHVTAAPSPRNARPAAVRTPSAGTRAVGKAHVHGPKHSVMTACGPCNSKGAASHGRAASHAASTTHDRHTASTTKAPHKARHCRHAVIAR